MTKKRQKEPLQLMPRTYLIQKINNKTYFEEDKIHLQQTDTSTVITEYYKHDTLTYNMSKNFINIGSGGYNNRIISINIDEDNFKLDTGIEKLLYLILQLTK